jgi:hypothetical protein
MCLCSLPFVPGLLHDIIDLFFLPPSSYSDVDISLSLQLSFVLSLSLFLSRYKGNIWLMMSPRFLCSFSLGAMHARRYGLLYPVDQSPLDEDEYTKISITKTILGLGLDGVVVAYRLWERATRVQFPAEARCFCRHEYATGAIWCACLFTLPFSTKYCFKARQPLRLAEVGLYSIPL